MTSCMSFGKNIILNKFHRGYGTPRKRGSKEIHSRRTRDLYLAEFARFCFWLFNVMGYNPYMMMDEAAMYIQAYLDHLAWKGLRWATIHTALAALCKVFDRKMANYVIPVDHLAPIKGRIVTPASLEAEKKYPLEAKFCRVVGIRLDEYIKLTGRDFVRSHGLYWVIVRQGKGGKKQYQLIPKRWAAFVEKFFKRVGKDERVFDPKVMKALSTHRYRRELAREMYFTYKKILDTNPDAARIFEEMICKTMRRAGVDPNSKPDMRRLNKPYVTQGKVQESMKAQGMPTTYNRLALMMVAVYHLSHWRANVVVQNYMR